MLSIFPVFSAGSVYRDEFDLAILKLQEDNRLEILKRKWWDGGKCPKEEDHRAKGLSPFILGLALGKGFQGQSKNPNDYCALMSYVKLRRKLNVNEEDGA